MRILWFTSTPSNYKTVETGYNGCGWISSIEKEVCKAEDVTLAISFKLNDKEEKVKVGNVTYYPISIQKHKIAHKLIHFFNIKTSYKERKSNVSNIMHVIEDFKPDIIHIFGSENEFGLIAKYTSVPIVLHIQGVLNPYLNAFLPPFISWGKYIYSNINPIKLLKSFRDKINIKRSSSRERVILSNIQYFIGRTEWDKRIAKLYSPQSVYFYGGEILRETFYQPAQRTLPQKLKIVSTISKPCYKGYDVILKTASMLKQLTSVDFEWYVYGNVDGKLQERITGINTSDCNIELKGVATEYELRDALLDCTVYVHPSYIDNSPNSVCEAQILGVTVIATYVGGIPSLIDNGNTGFLVPANDPFQTAYLIKHLYENDDTNLKIGNRAKEVASERHNKNKIVKELLDTYNEILNYEKTKV